MGTPAADNIVNVLYHKFSINRFRDSIEYTAMQRSWLRRQPGER